MESVYNKAKSEEVVAEMRGAIGRACGLLTVGSFVQDLDREASLAAKCALGPDRKTCANAWFRQFCSLKGHLAPSVVLPTRASVLSILGRPVRPLSLCGAQLRVAVSRGVDFRAALRTGRSTDFQATVRARDRDTSLEHSPSKMPRTR